MKKIAVIGTGIMGSGIVSNFLKKGYLVTVWNRSKNKLGALTNKGASVARTPKEAVSNSDIVFEVTANDKSSKSVWLSENGILAGASKEKILVTNATLSVHWVDELRDICAERKLTFFDMPMTGGRIGAESGNLVLLVGGDSQKLKSIEKDLVAIAGKVIYFGKAGSGIRFKLILNALQAVHIIALGDSIKFAKELGLDIKRAGDALAERPGGTTTNLAWRDYQLEPKPINFSVEWITKDLTYAKSASGKMKTPLLNEALKRYRKVIKKGMSQKDWTAVNKLP